MTRKMSKGRLRWWMYIALGMLGATCLFLLTSYALSLGSARREEQVKHALDQIIDQRLSVDDVKTTMDRQGMKFMPNTDTNEKGERIMEFDLQGLHRFKLSDPLTMLMLGRYHMCAYITIQNGHAVRYFTEPEVDDTL